MIQIRKIDSNKTRSFWVVSKKRKSSFGLEIDSRRWLDQTEHHHVMLELCPFAHKYREKHERLSQRERGTHGSSINLVSLILANNRIVVWLRGGFHVQPLICNSTQISGKHQQDRRLINSVEKKGMGREGLCQILSPVAVHWRVNLDTGLPKKLVTLKFLNYRLSQRSRAFPRLIFRRTWDEALATSDWVKGAAAGPKLTR